MRPIVKSHRKGYVSNDGNGMVGGRWESATRLGYKDINVHFSILHQLTHQRRNTNRMYIGRRYGRKIPVMAL